jgi:hypothetical protein
MNWCKPHWDRLREIIKDKGLDQFGAKSAEAAAQDMVDQAEGKDTDFDPLMGSWARINARMIESPGCRGRILECPLCILVHDGQPELVEGWLQGVTDSAYNHAVGTGLIKIA